MDSFDSEEKTFDFSEANINKLKEKYSQEMKDHEDNPIKVCMRLIFSAAIEKEPSKQSDLALELSRFLTNSDGVINLFLALIDFDTSSQKVTTHNQRFMAVANIISRLPKLCMPYEDYCKNISLQLRPLLVSDERKYSSLACIITKSMIESPHAQSKSIEEIFLVPLFSPLFNLDSPMRPHNAVVAINNLVHNHLPTKFFIKVFPNLFYALSVLYDTPSRLKPLLKSSIIGILNGLSPGVACCLIEETLFHSHATKHSYSICAEDSGISIKIIDKGSESPKEIDDQLIGKILISLLEDSDSELLILEFFFHFQASMWTARDDKNRKLSASIIEPLLQQTVDEESSKLDLLGIIANNSNCSFDLILRTLLNYVSFLRTDPGQRQDIDRTNKLINSSIGSCFNILEVLFATTSKDIGSMYMRCLPILKQIQELLEEKEKQEHSANDEDLLRNLHSLISGLESNSRINSQFLSDFNGDEQFELGFKHIIKDLNDKLVPTRVHALVRLKQMILANDHRAVSRIPQIHDMIKTFMADPEPYVFLACINLMSEMAIRNTDYILPKLIELYSKQGLDLQHRINVGEVLVRLVKQMKSTTPYYAQQVINILFVSCKDPEELMRMSSLTNIGEICHNLGDSLGKYIVEILSCIQNVIDSDTIPVKCAAIDLLRTTLSGLDKLTVESIQRDLKSMYGLLKKLKYRTLDERLGLQVDLALDEIDRLAREMLGLVLENRTSNGDNLVKNLKVLSLVER